MGNPCTLGASTCPALGTTKWYPKPMCPAIETVGQVPHNRQQGRGRGEYPLMSKTLLEHCRPQGPTSFPVSTQMNSTQLNQSIEPTQLGQMRTHHKRGNMAKLGGGCASTAAPLRHRAVPSTRVVVASALLCQRRCASIAAPLRHKEVSTETARRPLLQAHSSCTDRPALRRHRRQSRCSY